MGNEMFFKDELPVEGVVDCLLKWEALGFLFGEISGSSIFASYPSGWTKHEYLSTPQWCDIKDKKGHTRAVVFTNKDAHGVVIESSVALLCRYSTTFGYANGGANGVVYDRLLSEYIHCGEFLEPKTVYETPVEQNEWEERKAAVISNLEKWLDVTFPKWRDPLAYWN